MNRGNKKTKKVIKPKTAKKSLKKKPVKTAGKVKKSKKVKAENILGSNLPPAEVLGTKIQVQEIAEEPVMPVQDLAVAETISDYINEEVQNNDTAEVADLDVSEIPPQYEAQPQVADVAEDYYIQKELSPRQKNIIMWASLSAIMGVLIFFWGLSIKNSMSQIIIPTGLGAENQKLLEEFQGVLGDFQENLSAATNQTNTNTANNQLLEDIKTQITNNQVKDDVAAQLKEKLENLNANTNANTANLNSAN